MKKIILSVCAVMAMCTGMLAQQRNCGTMDYLELRKQQDPALEQRMADEDLKIREWIKQHPVEDATTIHLPPMKNFTPTGNIAVDRVNYAKAKQEFVSANGTTVKPGITDEAKVAALREKKRKTNSFISK